MNLTQSDLDIAARTVYGEARGEDDKGKLWVASVMVNRWKATKGLYARDDTLASACLRHLQFSVWTKDDPNFTKIQQVGPDNPTFLDCLKAVLEALTGQDKTAGATLYHTVQAPSWARSWPPVWAKKAVKLHTVGSHVFYRE